MYSCQDGYRFPARSSNQSFVTTCSEAGIWEPVIENCTGKNCLMRKSEFSQYFPQSMHMVCRYFFVCYITISQRMSVIHLFVFVGANGIRWQYRGISMIT